MTGPILCVGALGLDTIFRLDALPSGSGKFLPLEAIEVVEGMATAQATTIVRLGGRARLWASVGDDATGRRIIDDLAAEGIDTTAIRTVAGARSGFASVFVDRTGERMIVPCYDHALSAPPAALPDFADIAAVSVDVRWPDAAVLALRAARDRDIPCIADIDIGPRDALLAVFEASGFAIASEGGATILTGATDAPDAVRRMALVHTGFVAVTVGSAGVYWYDRAAGEVRHIPAPSVTSIDTLAAGDVFHGAFAQRLAEGAASPDALRFAAAAAAIKCTRFGGRLGAPTRTEVELLLNSPESGLPPQ